MHNISYFRVSVCVFVYSLQAGFLWVLYGRPVQINIVNRLCVCTNSAYVDSLLSLFERQPLGFLVHDAFAVLLSQCKRVRRCCRCCKLMFAHRNQRRPALTSEYLPPSLRRTRTSFPWSSSASPNSYLSV